MVSASPSATIDEIVRANNKATRFRIRDVHTLRDYLCVHRMNHMWMCVVCLSTGFQTQFLTIDRRFFCLSRPAEIEYMKTMKASQIKELIELNTNLK